jgi:hypothetical protein
VSRFDELLGFWLMPGVLGHRPVAERNSRCGSAGSRTEAFAWAPRHHRVKVVGLVETEFLKYDGASVTVAAEIHPGSTSTYTAHLDDIPNLIHKGVSAILLAQPRSQTWRTEYFAILPF